MDLRRCRWCVTTSMTGREVAFVACSLPWYGWPCALSSSTAAARNVISSAALSLNRRVAPRLARFWDPRAPIPIRWQNRTQVQIHSSGDDREAARVNLAPLHARHARKSERNGWDEVNAMVSASKTPCVASKLPDAAKSVKRGSVFPIAPTNSDIMHFA